MQEISRIGRTFNEMMVNLQSFALCVFPAESLRSVQTFMPTHLCKDANWHFALLPLAME